MMIGLTKGYSMNILIVLAHPERQSLNGALVDIAARELGSLGHEVRLSDLYRMEWKATVDRADFPHQTTGEPFNVAASSAQAYKNGELTEDVKEEQEKLLWADAVIFQFPLWWFSAPAILKGWIERVFSAGFAYGTGKSYGDGSMKGKRAMLSVTIGGTEHDYAARGICGPIEDLLFPLTHGTLFYTGFATLPSFLVYNADRLEDYGEGFPAVVDRFRERLATLETTPPIAFRSAASGDYDPKTRELRPGLEEAHAHGFNLHIKKLS